MHSAFVCKHTDKTALKFGLAACVREVSESITPEGVTLNAMCPILITSKHLETNHCTLGCRNLGFRPFDAIAAATAGKFVVSSPVEEQQH